MLRRQGLSYSEVLKQIPVAKSTLSLWLRSVGLSKRQRQRLTEKKLVAMRYGWLRQHQKRLELIKRINLEAATEFGKLKNNRLWLLGVALYWAEGTKEKESNIGQGVSFNNSDPRMIKLFLRWLKEILNIPEEDIRYEIYIHKNTGNVEQAIRYWSRVINCNRGKFRVYFKRHSLKTNRKNVGRNYNGLLRITVRRSTNLNRRIAAWVDEICKNYEATY